MEYYGIKYFQIIVCFVPIFKIIREYHFNIMDYYSAIEKLNLKRLVVIYFVFLILWGIDVSDYISIRLFGERNVAVGAVLIYSSLIINFVFANLLLLFSLTHSDKPSESILNFKPKKYERSNLSSHMKVEYSLKLKTLLENEKLFLKPDLTLNEISSILGISTRNLSKVINEMFNKNFYDLINSYRIEAAKSQFSNCDKSKTILEILYELGFNSKSDFNSAFKKNTCMTPTEFRTKYLK